MNIAIFTDLLLEVPGGIPSSIMAQKTALENLGHSVTIFCPGFPRKNNRPGSYEKPKSKNGAEKDKNIVILPTAKHFNVNGAPLSKNGKKVLQFIIEKYPKFDQDFDLIHAHYEAGASIGAVYVAKYFHLPLVQTMHGREDMAVQTNVPHPIKTLAGFTLNHFHKHFLKPYSGENVSPIVVRRDEYLAKTVAQGQMWELMARQANCADLVLTPSEHFAEKLKYYRVIKPIRVVSNGVPDEITKIDWQIRKFEPKAAGETFKHNAKTSAQQDTLRLIWFSRVSKEKRIMPFLEALRLVQNENSNFHFTVLGNGNELNKAKKYVAKNNLRANVEFRGMVPHDEVMKYLGNQHLSVINSYGFDTQGLTILEAAAAGLPTIYCDEDMDKIVIKNGAVKAKNHTPRAMANAILDILQHPEKIEKMSRACLDHQKDVLQSTQVKILEKAYEDTIKNYQKSSKNK